MQFRPSPVILQLHFKKRLRVSNLFARIWEARKMKGFFLALGVVDGLKVSCCTSKRNVVPYGSKKRRTPQTPKNISALLPFHFFLDSKRKGGNCNQSCIERLFLFSPPCATRKRLGEKPLIVRKCIRAVSAI